ncbi:hypothetical protein [Fibrobacter sp. UWR3]|nr:hypothetical protein [Fibrobacter sp. UWR3]
MKKMLFFATEIETRSRESWLKCDLQQARKRECDFSQTNEGLECDLTQ